MLFCGPVICVICAGTGNPQTLILVIYVPHHPAHVTVGTSCHDVAVQFRIQAYVVSPQLLTLKGRVRLQETAAHIPQPVLVNLMHGTDNHLRLNQASDLIDILNQILGDICYDCPFSGVDVYKVLLFQTQDCFPYRRPADIQLLLKLIFR